MTRVTRRGLLVGAAASAVGACAACAGAGPPPPPTSCDTPSAGAGVGYCLVATRVLRVTGAARITSGEVMLGALDDNSAALVGRDAGGLYARSAICTHACCVVGVCSDGACAAVVPSPSACEATAAVAVPLSGAALLCPCHGSTFDATGVVITGPATRALPALALRVDGADVLVDLGTAVDPSARA